jgi:magnesium-transporting ATPase (P-type)
MLTGESVPVSKNLSPVPERSGLGDRKCLAYSATSVSAGQGLGVVVATGETLLLPLLLLLPLYYCCVV